MAKKIRKKIQPKRVVSVSKKIVLIALVTSVLASALYTYLVYWSFARLRPFSTSQAILTTVDMHYAVDIVKKNDDGTYTISGWIFKGTSPIKVANNHVVLKDLQTNQYFLANTEMVQHDDVAKVYTGQKYAGFTSRILQLNPNHTYEIEIYYQSDGNNILLDTGKILHG